VDGTVDRAIAEFKRFEETGDSKSKGSDYYKIYAEAMEGASQEVIDLITYHFLTNHFVRAIAQDVQESHENPMAALMGALSAMASESENETEVTKE